MIQVLKSGYNTLFVITSALLDLCGQTCINNCQGTSKHPVELSQQTGEPSGQMCYLTVTAHYVTLEWEIKSSVLHLADALMGALTEWKLERINTTIPASSNNADKIVNTIKEATGLWTDAGPLDRFQLCSQECCLCRDQRKMLRTLLSWLTVNIAEYLIHAVKILFRLTHWLIFPPACGDTWMVWVNVSHFPIHFESRKLAEIILLLLQHISDPTEPWITGQRSHHNLNLNLLIHYCFHPQSNLCARVQSCSPRSGRQPLCNFRDFFAVHKETTKLKQCIPWCVLHAPHVFQWIMTHLIDHILKAITSSKMCSHKIRL